MLENAVRALLDDEHVKTIARLYVAALVLLLLVIVFDDFALFDFIDDP